MSEPGIGHNSQTALGQRLRSFCERIENLEEEKKEIAEQIKDVKAEAKEAGVDPKALAAVLSLRKKDAATRALIGAYADAVDLFG